MRRYFVSFSFQYKSGSKTREGNSIVIVEDDFSLAQATADVCKKIEGFGKGQVKGTLIIKNFIELKGHEK